MSLLQIDDLAFAYPDPPPIAEGWTARIGPGLTLLHGDTGSGKSTLLRLLAGAPADRGDLTLDGVRLADDAEAYSSRVFFIEPWTDAWEQVTARACIDALAVGERPFDEARWQAILAGFGLPPHLDKPMYMLSTGSKRKVFLAAALASGRPLLLLDEPTGALDAGSIRCLWAALADLLASPSGQRQAVVVASSDRIDALPVAACIELPLA